MTLKSMLFAGLLPANSMSLDRFRALFRLLTATVIAAANTSLVSADRSAADPTPPATAPAPYVPPENPSDLLRLDDVMRDFFDRRVSEHLADRERLHAIVDSILQPDGLNFAYDTEATTDVRETFRRRRGNCVSFSFLIVAVTRHYGFAASFQNLSTQTKWDRFGGIIASIEHVNIRVETDDAAFVIDLQPDLITPTDALAMREIRDERAHAQFYNDVGFFRLVHGDPAEALRYMRRATEIDPRFASAWSNLGNVYLRIGDYPSARSCFERSLREDRQELSALGGLAFLLRNSGQPDDLKAAEKYERRAESRRQQNPYYHQHLADLAAQKGDWTEADKRLKRAIALKRDEPEFYQQWIGALQHLGRANDIERAQRKLQDLRRRRATTQTLLR